MQGSTSHNLIYSVPVFQNCFELFTCNGVFSYKDRAQFIHSSGRKSVFVPHESHSSLFGSNWNVKLYLYLGWAPLIHSEKSVDSLNKLSCILCVTVVRIQRPTVQEEEEEKRVQSWYTAPGLQSQGGKCKCNWCDQFSQKEQNHKFQFIFQFRDFHHDTKFFTACHIFVFLSHRLAANHDWIHLLGRKVWRTPRARARDRAGQRGPNEHSLHHLHWMDREIRLTHSLVIWS